jgi:hypothetical protein
MYVANKQRQFDRSAPSLIILMLQLVDSGRLLTTDSFNSQGARSQRLVYRCMVYLFPSLTNLEHTAHDDYLLGMLQEKGTNPKLG